MRAELTEICPATAAVTALERFFSLAARGRGCGDIQALGDKSLWGLIFGQRTDCISSPHLAILSVLFS